MAETPTPQPGIMDIALYQGGASSLPGRRDVLKLSSNENPYGVPEAVPAAIADAAAQLHRYPSTDHAALRAALGARWGLDPDRIICGAGSDEIIHFLCQAYAGPGDDVIHTRHGFAMYRISTLAAGATPVEAPETDRRVDVDKVIDRVTDRTRLVFIANPANPTGTIIPEADLERLAKALPGAILVIDGAYAEYAGDWDGGARLAGRLPNVVMMRTFSKAFGLGGLRVGWGFGPQAIIDVLNRLRGPFNLGNLQLAAAEAALADHSFYDRTVSENARLRDWLTGALRETGVAVDDSAANFVLARFADEGEAGAAEAALREAGILVRKVAGYNIPEGLRITVGDEHGCARVAATIRAFRNVSA